MHIIIPSRIPRIPKQVVVTVFMGDLSFIHNLFEEEKMEHLSEITLHTYLDTSLFSLATASIEDVLVIGNPSRERDTWEGKCEDMSVSARPSRRS